MQIPTQAVRKERFDEEGVIDAGSVNHVIVVGAAVVLGEYVDEAAGGYVRFLARAVVARQEGTVEGVWLGLREGERGI